MTARLYVVEVQGGVMRLVKATSQAQAINHVIRPFCTARIPTSLEVVEMLAEGHILGDATTAQPTKQEDESA